MQFGKKKTQTKTYKQKIVIYRCPGAWFDVNVIAPKVAVSFAAL